MVSTGEVVPAPFRVIIAGGGRSLLEIIYRHIYDNSKVDVGHGIVCYEQTEKVVSEATDPGEIIEGSIRIGSDGIYSKVRSAGSPGFIFGFLFNKSGATKSTPNIPRYSEEDAEAAISMHGTDRVGHDCTIQESTINVGLGGQTGLEDVCYIANGVEVLLKQTPAPLSLELEKLFEEYERHQRPRADHVTSSSGFSTDVEAKAIWVHGMLLWWIVARLPDWFMAYIMNQNIYTNAALFNFLPTPEDRK
ncbi:hypothetical protein BX600DRAFT_530530 [Xylariales sp. PMI_506]|nr:hypothetical protein BX600DRAFT_530530 [Xylariales sp. PMI_506]